MGLNRPWRRKRLKVTCGLQSTSVTCLELPGRERAMSSSLWGSSLSISSLHGCCSSDLCHLCNKKPRQCHSCSGSHLAGQFLPCLWTNEEIRTSKTFPTPSKKRARLGTRKYESYPQRTEEKRNVSARVLYGPCTMMYYAFTFDLEA